MRVIFTCGGTGGHINPAIAVAKLLLARRPDTQILFVGAKGGMEENLIPRENFRLETVKISSYERKLTPKAMAHNVGAALQVLSSRRRANQIIEQFKPDVIVGTGGYASYPMLRQGAKNRIPTAVHEANAVPGLTTRLVADNATSIMVCFEESKNAYKHPQRVCVVGMPVRQEFIFTKRSDARKRLGFGDELVIVSAMGSNGAREMNKAMTEFMRLECEKNVNWRHIHATGSFGWRWMPDYVREHGVDLEKHRNIDMREYIFDMPDLLAAADLVISRAGASSLNEIMATGTPCIIVPSPNVTDNHQEKNARILEQCGAATVLRESDCSGQTLFDTAEMLLNNNERRTAMRSALQKMAVVDSAERICEVILKLAKER